MGYTRWGNENRPTSGFTETILAADGSVPEDMLTLAYTFKCGT